MTQKGPHTWDIVVDYCRCPHCGFILENREKPVYREGMYRKSLVCPRCHKDYQVTRGKKPTFGPLFGDPQPVEWDWS